jgi:large subunit ribosomal protein L17
MRHGIKLKKLGRKAAHRLALLKNLCRALFIHERIKTTLQKAKEARRLAERLIEFAKHNDLAAKRYVYRYIPDHKLVKIICGDIAPKFAERKGGYTRIYRLGPRTGDGAEMVILELIERSDDGVLDQRRKLIERRHVAEKKAKKDKAKKEKEQPKKKEEGAKEKIKADKHEKEHASIDRSKEKEKEKEKDKNRKNKDGKTEKQQPSKKK